MGAADQQVRLKLDQRLLLEGESFQADLTLANQLTSQNVDNIRVSLRISDTSNVPVNASFIITPVVPTLLTDTLPAGQQVLGSWLIVPSESVTNTTGKRYSAAAEVRYKIGGVSYAFTTLPEEFTVLPAPQLIIDYELPGPNNICTTFDLRATVRNVGAGSARGVNLTSGQPKIVEITGNKFQGFTIVAVTVDGQPLSSSPLEVDLGEIAAGGEREVIWRMRAAQPGRFIEFTSDYADYHIENYYGLSLVPRLQAINTTFSNAPCQEGLEITVRDNQADPQLLPLDPGDETRYVMTTTLTEQGWYRENPVKIQVVASNALVIPDNACVYLTIQSEQADNPRFYALTPKGHKFIEDLIEPPILPASNQISAVYMTDWSEILEIKGFPVLAEMDVWIQPSISGTLQLRANLVDCTSSNGYNIVARSKTVAVPTANIHPVVFMHGILGSMPPRDGVITTWPQNLLTYGKPPTDESYLDPWIDSYKPIIENMMKMGYELDKSMFIVTYDWRQSNRRSANHLRNILSGRMLTNTAGVPYIKREGSIVQADVVVHSMGGMVLRSYLEDLATDGSTVFPYEGNVNQAIFIASPHQGFPVTYNTYEGMTWKDYFSDEVSFQTDFLNFTYALKLSTLMDNLVWPYFIIKRYNPNPDEPCASILQNPGNLVSNFLNNSGVILGGAFGGCPYQALYYYSHYPDSDKGIYSMPEMLPPALINPPFLKNSAGDIRPYGTTVNSLLDTYGLNSAEHVAKLKRLGSDDDAYDNLYVIYNAAQLTPFVYTVDAPKTWPAICAGPADEVPVNGVCPSGTVFHEIRPWPHGKPVGTPDNDDGDGLIPGYSTQLSRVLPTGSIDNQEFLIDQLNENGSSGHVLIMVEKQTQSIVGAILTGILTPAQAQQGSEREGADFPIYTKYEAPWLLGYNGDVMLAYLFWSPVDGLITDPLGRRIGFDPVTNQTVNEIPGAFYSGPGSEEEFILIPSGLDGQYQITTRGTGSGDFAVSGHFVDSVGAETIDVVTGTTTSGQVMTQTLVYSPNVQVIFADDMESGDSNWLTSTTTTAGMAATWMLTTTITGPADTYSQPTAWSVGETGVVTPGDAITLTLKVPLDLSQARRARLTFWYSATLSSEAEGLVEGSLDGGQNWFTLAHQPTTPAQTFSGTTVLTAPVYFNPGWNRRVLDLSTFTGPEGEPLHLRFRLTPGATTDRWWLDDVRVEEIIIPDLFGFPFSDDVEGLNYWNADGGWSRTTQQAHSGQRAWQSGQTGDQLSLAGNIRIPPGITPTLTFWQIVSPTVHGIVEVSTDDGASWTPVYTTTLATSEWSRAKIGLDWTTGLTTTLRFRQEAGPVGGWLIDDIAVDRAIPVYHLPFTDDMESPERNWFAVGGWQPVTDTAHSLQTSWRSQVSDSHLQLAGSLELSGTVTPTLTFWHRFDLPAGSLGQVQVSSDDGLSWQPVLTVTTPITTWTPLTASLSMYIGQQVRLAFELISVTTPLTNQGWYVDDVQVAETQVISAFHESGGMVVMEAEHFTQQITHSQHLWLPQTNLPGYIGEGYLIASPDTDLQFSDSYTTASPELQFTFQVNLTGTYHVWLRGYAPNGAGDSLYIGLDNQVPFSPTILTGFVPQQWGWANITNHNTLATLEITEPGLHTLYLWIREDGLRLDRVLLTTDSGYTPTGDGPAESDYGP